MLCRIFSIYPKLSFLSKLSQNPTTTKLDQIKRRQQHTCQKQYYFLDQFLRNAPLAIDVDSSYSRILLSVAGVISCDQSRKGEFYT